MFPLSRRQARIHDELAALEDLLLARLGRAPLAVKDDGVLRADDARRGGLRTYSGFTPDDLDSLAHWYDAAEIAGSDGDSVGTWSDEEGTDDLTQGTGSKQPTLQTGVIHGNPVVRFDGADDILQTGSWTNISQPYHVFIAFQFNSAPSNSSNEFVTDGDANRARAILNRGNNQGNWAFDAGAVVSSSTAADQVAHISASKMDGANSVLRLDGSNIATGDAGSNAFDGLTVGAANNDTSHAPVDVLELLVFDTDLAAVDRDRVEAYLSGTSGIAI